MAIVPRAAQTQQVQRAPVGPQSLSTSGAFGQQIGQAIGGLAQEVSNIAIDRLERQKQLDDATFAIESDTETREFWTKEIERRRQEAVPGEQLREEVLADFDRRAAETLKTSPSDEASVRTQAKLASYRNALMNDVGASDSRAKAERVKTAADGAIQVAANQILSDPTKFGEIRERVATDLVEMSSSLPEAAQDLLVKHAMDQMAVAFGNAMVAADPAGLIEILDSGKLDTQLTLTNKNTLLVQARNEIERRAKADLKIKARELSAQNVQRALVGDYNLDPKSKTDKAALDSFYFDDLLPGMSDLPQADQDTIKVGLVNRVGIMPETMRAEVRGVLRSSTDPKDVARVSNMVDEININQPKALEDLSAKDIEKAVWISNAVSSGVPPEDAINRYDEVVKIDDRVVNVRITDAQKSDPFQDAAQNIGQSFDTLFGFQPDVPDLLVAEFRTLYEQSYVRHGDEDVAKQTALSDIRTTWGVSDLGHRKQVMKLAPEMLYGRFGGGRADSKWMHDQFISDLSQDAVWAKGWEKKVFIQPDNATSRTGDYPVLIQRGDAIDQLRDADNQILRWNPEWAASEPAQKQMAETAENLQDSQFQRELWLKHTRGEISTQEYLELNAPTGSVLFSVAGG